MKKHFKKASIWLKAARLRTLPLALAVSFVGNLTASYSPHFQWNIVFLSVLTTLLLQILSNFANDLGDSIHGADHVSRKGPMRTVQSGELTKDEMGMAVKLLGILSLLSGLALLWISFHYDWSKSIPILGIGLLAIVAAYLYTNGPKPYGYQALGDISVFVFFGFVAVCGTQYLHLGQVEFSSIWPSLAMGCWSTAVLNINNMRDIDSDKIAGKETIPTRIGLENAKRYHFILIAIGTFSLIYFGILQSDLTFWASIPGLFLILKCTIAIAKTRLSEDLDKFLKPQALGTFIVVICVILLKLFA